MSRVAIQDLTDQVLELEIEVEAVGTDTVTTAVTVPGAQGQTPGTAVVDCDWPVENDQFTIDVRQFPGERDGDTVHVPGERSRQMDPGNCVGVEFIVGSSVGPYVTPEFYSCESYEPGAELRGTPE